MAAEIHHGDCIEIMRTMADCSVDAVITDPPYGLSREPDAAEVLRRWLAGDDYKHRHNGFMGKSWDSFVPGPAVWREAFRVLKPGGHLLSFFGTRTYDLGVMALRLAGFEIRDRILMLNGEEHWPVWIFGSGFPKSVDVSKAIDKAAGRIGQSVTDLKRRLIDLADASGKTRSAIDAECGFRATNYLTLPAEGKRPDPWVNCLPPRKKWLRMKIVLGAGDDLDEMFAHAEREVIGTRKVAPGVAFTSEGPTELDITIPATDVARQWQGFGTSLKPAHEPICVARKPLEGTVAANILKWGSGGLNVDGCRIATQENTARANNGTCLGLMNDDGWQPKVMMTAGHDGGRWPANVIHDGSPEVVAGFPQAPGQIANASQNSEARKTQNIYGAMRRGRAGEPSANNDNEGAVGFKMKPGARRLDSGSTARFFKHCPPDDEDRRHMEAMAVRRFYYCPKASKKDRDEGLEAFAEQIADPYAQHRGRRMPAGSDRFDGKPAAFGRNHHPTVKPTSLMRYLCRLITPPGGVILDPFAGSGSTGKAAMLEGFRFIGIEIEAEYVEIARARIAAARLKEKIRPNNG